MKCQNESGCDGGMLDGAKTVPIRTGCMSFEQALVCPVCGRIHWPDGSLVFNRQDHRAFLENGVIVNRDENGVEDSRFAVGT